MCLCLYHAVRLFSALCLSILRSTDFLVRVNALEHTDFDLLSRESFKPFVAGVFQQKHKTPPSTTCFWKRAAEHPDHNPFIIHGNNKGLWIYHFIISHQVWRCKYWQLVNRSIFIRMLCSSLSEANRLMAQMIYGLMNYLLTFIKPLVRTINSLSMP